MFLISDSFGNSSTLDLATGLEELIGSLFLDGVEQLAGTHGASGSGAMFINDEFFSGQGILRVAGSVSAVPEPSCLSIFAVACTALATRRRQRTAC